MLGVVFGSRRWFRLRDVRRSLAILKRSVSSRVRFVERTNSHPDRKRRNWIEGRARCLSRSAMIVPRNVRHLTDSSPRDLRLEGLPTRSIEARNALVVSQEITFLSKRTIRISSRARRSVRMVSRDETMLRSWNIQDDTRLLVLRSTRECPTRTTKRWNESVRIHTCWCSV